MPHILTLIHTNLFRCIFANYHRLIFSTNLDCTRERIVQFFQLGHRDCNTFSRRQETIESSKVSPYIQQIVSLKCPESDPDFL